MLYSVRHGLGHHGHVHEHPHTHPFTGAPLGHTHDYALPVHDHQHEHALLEHEHNVETPLGHVHFWVLAEKRTGPRNDTEVGIYRCDVPGCDAKCVHEYGA